MALENPNVFQQGSGSVMRYSNPNQLGSNFIGPEGGNVTWGIKADQSGVQPLSVDPRQMDDATIQKQISIARQKDATTGLNQQERDDLNSLQTALSDRQSHQTQVENLGLSDTLGTNSQPGQVPQYQAQPFSLADYLQSAQNSAQKQREAYGTAFDTSAQAGANQIAQSFIPARQQQIQEEASLGRLRSPVSISTIGGIDAAKNQAISNYIANLGSQRATGLAGVESNLGNQINQANQFGTQAGFTQQGLGLQGQQLAQNKQLSLAQMLQQNTQFNKNFGLQSQNQIDTERNSALGDLRTQQAIQAAKDAATQKAQNEKPGLLDQISGGVQLGSSLVGLGGGIKGLMASKTV